MKKYLYNPEDGSVIKNWWDGNSHWSLDVGECAMFPERVGLALKETYGFLQEIDPEEFELRLNKLEKEEVPKVKPNADGQLVPKDEEEVEEDEKVLETKKETAKKVKEKVDKAKDAEPQSPGYWELTRGALIAECNKREIDIKGLHNKGVYISKEQLINLLESDDTSGA